MRQHDTRPRADCTTSTRLARRGPGRRRDRRYLTDDSRRGANWFRRDRGQRPTPLDPVQCRAYKRASRLPATGVEAWLTVGAS